MASREREYFDAPKYDAHKKCQSHIHNCRGWVGSFVPSDGKVVVNNFQFSVQKKTWVSTFQQKIPKNPPGKLSHAYPF